MDTSKHKTVLDELACRSDQSINQMLEYYE